MRHRLATPAALAVLVLGLASCTGSTGSGLITEAPSYPNQGSDDGGESPEESDGGGDEEGDEQAAPDIPAPDPADYPGMDENTPEGAEQFTRYFVALMLWGYQTGESTEFDRLYTGECGTCANITAALVDLRERDEYWSEFQAEEAAIETSEGSEYDYVVSYATVVPPHSEPSPDGGAPTDIEELRYSMGVGVNWDDGWRVEALYVEARSE